MLTSIKRRFSKLRVGGGSEGKKEGRERDAQVLLAAASSDMCIKEEKARFDAMVTRCKATGGKYTDEGFPAATDSASVVFKNKEDPTDELQLPHEWQRLSDICDNPRLFVDGVTADDIQQGCVGTCYLLGAMSSLATYHTHMEDLFVGYSAEVGIACVRFFKDGEWQVVVIDDYVGLNEDGTLWGAHCADKNEVWVPLIEKAYARLHGSYEAIDGGFLADAMIDLTGGSGESRLVSDLGSADPVFHHLDCVLKKDLVASCSIIGDQEANGGNGLLSGHAYGILKTAWTSHGHKLIQIRNPWGQSEWTGDWSDNSGMWTDELLSELDYQLGDDGTFWMSAEDFAAHWSHVDTCRCFHHPWVVASLSGTFAESDQVSTLFKLEITKGESQVGRCVIVVAQADQRLLGNDCDYKVPIGFNVYRCLKDEYNPSTRSWGPILKTARPVLSRQVSLEIDIDPRYTYVIMPRTVDTDDDMVNDGAGEVFNLRAYASLPIAVEDTGAPEFEPSFAVGTVVALQQQQNTFKFKGIRTFIGELVEIQPSAPHYTVRFDDGDMASVGDDWMQRHSKLYEMLMAVEGLMNESDDAKA